MKPKIKFALWINTSSEAYSLVDLLDGGPGAPGSGGRAVAAHPAHVRHTSGHAAGGAAGVGVELGDDGVADGLHLLLLLRELLHLGQLVSVQPLDRLVALVADGLLVVLGDLVLDLLVVQSRLHVEAVALQAVLGADPLLLLLVLGLKLLGVVDHALDLFLAEPALVVGDGDLVLQSSSERGT